MFLRAYNSNNMVLLGLLDTKWKCTIFFFFSFWLSQSIPFCRIVFTNRIFLMCTLRAHNNFHFFKKFSQELKKYWQFFSISEKLFLKMNNLICALRIYINLILTNIWRKWRSTLPNNLIRLLWISRIWLLL